MKTNGISQAEQVAVRANCWPCNTKNTRLQRLQYDQYKEHFGCFFFKVLSLEYSAHLRTSQNISRRTTNQRQAWQGEFDRLPGISNVLKRILGPGMSWLLDLLSLLGHLNTLNVSLES